MPRYFSRDTSHRRWCSWEPQKDLYPRRYSSSSTCRPGMSLRELVDLAFERFGGHQPYACCCCQSPSMLEPPSEVDMLSSR